MGFPIVAPSEPTGKYDFPDCDRDHALNKLESALCQKAFM
jgi:hypothetical protein